MDETTDNFDLATIGPDSRTVDDSADNALVRSASTGDEAAFEQIFERHKRRVGRIAGRFFNRPEKVEEVVQDVFTKLYFALGSYSRERGPSFVAWLSRITINSCYDELRRARRRPESSFGDITDDELGWLNARLRDKRMAPDAESALIARDLANKLLGRLSPEDRLVLTLLEVEGVSVSDIAELTGWSVSKVKVRAHRSRAALRNLVGDLT